MKIKLLVVLLVFQTGFSQHRTCGVKEQMQRIMNDPSQRQAYLEIQNKLLFWEYQSTFLIATTRLYHNLLSVI